jgi:minor extracellular serine protease Vpr
MIRTRLVVTLGIALFVADQRALTVLAAERPARTEAPVQLILRLAEPPVSAVAKSDRPGQPRPAASVAALRREQAHFRALRATQELLARRLSRQGVRVIARYQVAYNGLCVEAPPSMVARLSQLPGVISVSRVQSVYRNNTHTAPFIGAPTAWGQYNARGTGIRVAVIDSGIDYTHRAFGGPGTTAAYQANNPRLVERGSFPTPKVIAGYDFVGDDFPSGGPRPDLDPLDPAVNGHGTRIAGIIAGLEVPGQLPSGVAPGALLMAYKIYGRAGGSTQNIVLQALEQAMDPNGDGSTSDHADVINISGGTSRQGAGDPLVVAADYAAQLGAIVVGSAGNDGDHPYFVGGPGVAAGAISVGNSYGGGPIFEAVRVNSPAMGNVVAAEGALTAPLTPAGITADLVYVGTASAGSVLLSSPAGKIALVDRDGRPYTDKVRGCQLAGAVGIIVINNSTSAPTTMPGDRTGITIPGVMISSDDGSRLKAVLAAGQRVNVTLSNQWQTAAAGWVDRIDDASSRGPRRGDSLIKPDVVAPGVNILSAAAGTGDRAAPDTGTSAAAPVVAGIAALLRQLHPGWTVAEIKAAIANTAQPLTAGAAPYPVARQGSGRVQADSAVAAQALALADDETPSLSFGVIEDLAQPVLRRLLLVNKGSAPRQFTIRVDYLTRADEQGVSLTVRTPAEAGGRIHVLPGESVELEVTLAVKTEGLDPSQQEYDGFVTFTEVGGALAPIHVPFLAVLRSASAAEVSALSTGSLVMHNSAPEVMATARLFAWLIDDPADLHTEGDIRAVGVRSLLGPTPATTRVEFAVACHQPWSTPFGPQFTLYLDRDGDGRADIGLSNDDAGVMAGGARTGVPVGVLRDLLTGKLLASDLPVQTSLHSGAMVISASASQLGTSRSQRFTLWAQGWDPWRSDRQLDRTHRADFDPYQPLLVATPHDVQFSRSANVRLQLRAEDLPGIMVLFPSNVGPGQVHTLTMLEAATTAARRVKR